MPSPHKRHLIEKHQRRWYGLYCWLVFFFAFLITEAALGWCLYDGHPWAALGLMVLIGHLMHAHLIAFHESAHGSVCPSRVANDVVGMLVGFFGLMSLSLYRAVHHSHHTYLSSERDEEMWPFAIPGSPRWLRCLAAALELTVGLFYTPFLFLRSFLRKGTPVRNPAVRRRVWAELIFLAVAWAAVLAATGWLHLWSYLGLMYLAPALLAGDMQSLRKYVEHMGLQGSTVLGSTRSVISPTPLGRLISFSLFHEPFHGVHHRYARLPHDTMPEFAELLIPNGEGEPAPYPSYRRAFWEMVRSLPDPKVGAQWQREEQARGSAKRPFADRPMVGAHT